jgi:hypothetical protein
MQRYKNKTLHMLHKTIEDELVCAFIAVLITKDKTLPPPNSRANMQFPIKIRGTREALWQRTGCEHWSNAKILR